MTFESHKTKPAAAVFEALAKSNALIVDAPNQNLQRAVGNLPKVKFGVEGINVFDVLKYEYLIRTEPTVRRLEGAPEMSRDVYSVLRRPLVTEKTTFLKEDNNQLSFRSTRCEQD